MKDYTKLLPEHMEKYLGENDLFLETYKGTAVGAKSNKKPPLLFLHGAYTGSWMWSKYIPHFVEAGFNCYTMNLRSHYKSRNLDLTKVTFEDYLEDIKEVLLECEEPPVMIGFSMGGILTQKIAESKNLSGMILIDSSICRQVYRKVPYEKIETRAAVDIVPPPPRMESSSVDESLEDIEFQRKYLSMESGKAFSACSITFGASEGISIDNSRITCPTLVIRTANNEEEENRLKAEADFFNGEYVGMKPATHTGLLIGQRYEKGVEVILNWLKRF
jgi:pimeloyl-ACP methyl ester carboxylesterase